MSKRKSAGGDKRDGTPPLPTKRGRKSKLSQYDKELVEMNNKRYMPSKIAKVLAEEHELDPSFMNRKSVESRLSYLKKNKLGSLAPVNQKGRMRARDPPQNCISFSFFCLFFFSFFSSLFFFFFFFFLFFSNLILFFFFLFLFLYFSSFLSLVLFFSFSLIISFSLLSFSLQ
jgi:hypothetical protein